MYNKSFIFLIGMLALFSCSSPEETVNEENADQIEAELKAEVDYWSKNHCMRSEPAATIDPTKVSRHTFEVDKMKGRGIESCKINLKDSLSIIHMGCEIYWITYNYHTENSQLPDNNYDLVKYCMKNIQTVNSAPIDFAGSIKYLDSVQVLRHTMELGKEYFLQEDNVSEFFQIDEINLSGEEAEIVFSFAIGHQ